MISLLFVVVNSALLGRALFFTAISCFWMGLLLQEKRHKLVSPAHVQKEIIIRDDNYQIKS